MAWTLYGVTDMYSIVNERINGTQESLSKAHTKQYFELPNATCCSVREMHGIAIVGIVFLS